MTSQTSPTRIPDTVAIPTEAIVDSITQIIRTALGLIVEARNLLAVAFPEKSAEEIEIIVNSTIQDLQAEAESDAPPPPEAPFKE